MEKQTSSPLVKSPPRIFAGLLFLLLALPFIIGGGWLVSLGGSIYYLIAGIAILIASLLLFRGKSYGAWIYLAVVLASLIWAFYESGSYFWALLPRVLPLAVIGLWLLTPWARRGLDKKPVALPAFLTSLIVAVVLVATYWLTAPGVVKVTSPLALQSNPTTADNSNTQWMNYGNDLNGSRYSPTRQITPANVKQLQVAWQYRSGDLPKPFELKGYSFRNEATPLKIGNTLYTCTLHNQVIALDAATGKEKWRFDPKVDSTNAYQLSCRGVAYYEAPTVTQPIAQASSQADSVTHVLPAAAITTADNTTQCQQRIIDATIDGRMIAIDANTGQVCTSFGNNGTIDLRQQIGNEAEQHFYFPTSPPTIVDGKIIIGGQVADNQSDSEPSGVIRAYDAITGQLVWAWDVGAPDRTGAPPAGENFTQATPNSWTIFAADPQLGLVYVPLGNATPDFWGGHRRPYDEEYSTALVALDINTGRERWHFQTVHKDRWDYDLPAQPILTDVTTAKGKIPAVIQVTKVGDIYVLDRRTGTPIIPVTELPAPQGAAPGDTVSPTQPHSAMSLRPATLTEANMWGITPLDQLWCRIRFKQARYQGMFTPQGLTPAIIFPGQFGITDWGGASVDPENQILLMNSSGIPFYDTLVPRAQAPQAVQTYMKKIAPGQPLAKAGGEGGWGAQAGTPYAINNEPFLSPINVPCNQPPWGYMNALDLKTGKVLWRTLLGTSADNGPFGLHTHLPLKMGVPNIGGNVTTAGGLTFVGATSDNYIRAFDVKTGKEVWRHRLPAGAQATPMVYTVNGKEYVVITAGGHADMGSTIGDYTIAFALPN